MLIYYVFVYLFSFSSSPRSSPRSPKKSAQEPKERKTAQNKYSTYIHISVVPLLGFHRPEIYAVVTKSQSSSALFRYDGDFNGNNNAYTTFTTRSDTFVCFRIDYVFPNRKNPSPQSDKYISTPIFIKLIIYYAAGRYKQ